MRIICILLLLPMLMITGCFDDFVPGPDYCPCSLDPDGSNFRVYDARLYSNIRGRAYYVKDDLVFYAGTQIMKAPLGSNAPVIITPTSHTLSNDGIIAIDLPRQRLYYAFGGDIYQCGFSGENLINLSDTIDQPLSVPALSDDRNYLTAISNGKISRFDIANGVWTQLELPVWVRYAVYLSAESSFYYFKATNANGGLKLCRLGADLSTEESLMSLSGWANDLGCGVSPDFRFFSIIMRERAWQLEEDDMLRVWDRADNSTLDIPQVYTYAFSPVDAKLLYSTSTWGLADLRLLDMDSDAEILLIDGVYTPSTYSYTISKIDWRFDGGKIFYWGERGYRNRGATPDNPLEQITAPGAISRSY